MNGTHQVLAYADDVNLIGDDIRRGLGIDGRTILEWTLKR